MKSFERREKKSEKIVYTSAVFKPKTNYLIMAANKNNAANGTNAKGNSNNANGDSEATGGGGDKVIAFFLAPPTIPLILGSVFLLVARIVIAASDDVRAVDLWPEWVYGFTLLVVGVVLMFMQGFKEPRESFLPAIKNPLLRRIMRLAPLLASVIVFYIASTVARGSDNVSWSDVTLELVISLLLFGLGIFFLFKA